MAPDHLDLNEDNVDDMLVDDFELSNDSPELSNKSSDEKKETEKVHIQPRVGDEFQAELPQLISKSSYMSRSTSTDTNIRSYSLGLPIQLTWTSSTKHEDGLETFGPLDSMVDDEISPKGRVLVPGSNEHWSGAEKCTFVLGVYVFLKNFVVLRRFIQTKGLGAVMSMYYGRFYGRTECQRWLECKKAKSRKCVFGKRIFSGARQQELLSRIFPRVSEELRTGLVEVSRTFGEDGMSLEDYVVTLKAMVGMEILFDAVGIGKGKQDLTRKVLLPPKDKSNQPAIPLRDEIPTGAACSSLTVTEIIKFLTGGYRLSKARSNDLFWEAVWPRLLARGWHSEQPNSKSCLLFLIPGIKKFSPRKLVKGEDYFDSVPEVLSKVAKAPDSIMLETDQNEADNRKEERELASNNNEDEENDDVVAPKQNKHSYLQPKTPKRVPKRAGPKFMVVDTSSNGKIRELRELPSEIPSTFIPEGECVQGADKSRGKMPVVIHEVSRRLVVDLNDNKVLTEDRKTWKSLVRQGPERGVDGDYLAQINKCRKLSEGPLFENGSSSFSSGNFELHESSTSRAVDKMSSTGSSQGSPVPMMIDLNLPQLAPDFENGEQDNGLVQRPDLNGLPDDEVQPKEQPVVNPVRQSTRTRPLTMRAAEALAGGYMRIPRRRKGRDAHEEVGSSSRPFQRPRGSFSQGESSSSAIAQEAEAAGTSNTGSTHMPMENEHSTQAKE